jgi:hypothetical protein
MERVINLIFPVDTGVYWYPKWHYYDSAGYTKPRVIYIGDSFGNTFMHDGIMNANTDAEYWYYFRDVWGTDWEQRCRSHNMATYNWRGAMQNADCVVLLYTASQLVRTSDVFIDSAYNYYYPEK